MKKIWLILLIIDIVLEIGLTVIIPETKANLYKFIELHNSAVYLALAWFYINLTVLDLIQSLKNYLEIRTSLVYREKCTQDVLTQPLNNVDNIPQRIQDDIKYSYQYRITAGVEYVISGFILCYLVFTNYHQWQLIVGGLVYSAMSVLLALLFNPRLTYAEKSTQSTEASFRGFLSEKLSMLGYYVNQDANIKAASIRLQYLLFTKAQLAVMNVLPYIVLLPYYLDHKITLGSLVGAATTFSLVVLNASILISVFPVYIQGNASKERVEDLINK